MVRTIVTPSKREVSIQMPKNYIGKKVEVLYYMLDEIEVKEDHTSSLALPGSPISDSEFKNWIAQAEKGPTISLDESKSKWALKRKQLQKLIK